MMCPRDQAEERKLKTEERRGEEQEHQGGEIDDILIVRGEGGRCGCVPVVWQYDLFKQLLSAHERKELQGDDLDGTMAFFFRKFSREVVHKNWLYAEDALLRSRTHFYLPLHSSPHSSSSSSRLFPYRPTKKTFSSSSTRSIDTPKESSISLSRKFERDCEQVFLPVCSPLLMAPQFFIPSSDRRDLFWIAPSYSKGRRREEEEEESDARYSQGNQQEDRWEMKIWMKRTRSSRTRPTSSGRGTLLQHPSSKRRRRGETVLPLRLSSSSSIQEGEHSLRDREMSQDVDRDVSLSPSLEMRDGEKVNNRLDSQESSEKEKRRNGETLPERQGEKNKEGEEEKGGKEGRDREGLEEEQENVDEGGKTEKEENNTRDEEGKKRREEEEDNNERDPVKQQTSGLSKTRVKEGKGTEEKIRSDSLNSAVTTQAEKDKQQERRDVFNNDLLSPKDERSMNSPQDSSSFKRSSLESPENGTEKKENPFASSKDITTASLSELVDYLLSSSPSSSQLEEKKEEKEKENLCPSLLDRSSQEIVKKFQEDAKYQVLETSVMNGVAPRKGPQDGLSVSRHVSTCLANSQCDRKIYSDDRQLFRKRIRRRRNLMEVLFESTDDSSEEEKEEKEKERTVAILEEKSERREREESITGSSVSSFLISKEEEEEKSYLHSLAGCCFPRKLQASSRKENSEDEEREKQDLNGLQKVLRNPREKKTKKKKNGDLVKVTRRGPERLDRWLHLVAMEDLEDNSHEVAYSDAIPF
ncbi:hypothetical protein CSUI_002899 [Cystoisospora suis]|uniref:Uncharacterized protein n=1 Tax=Cystoisospora suis TaxID=483139 RepID=A0A2C6L7H6_9APIC|nr:hypothetical protein CSUI_002899 [Cystoisospora suis]